MAGNQLEAQDYSDARRPDYGDRITSLLNTGATMKLKFQHLQSLAAVLVLVLGLAGNANAETVIGKVTFVGTIGEYTAENEGYQAQFRFRVGESTCGNDKQPRERWIVARSGRMEGAFAHNFANTRNAYSTVMAAFLASKGIQIDGVPSCDASKTQTIPLWKSNIGMW